MSSVCAAYVVNQRQSAHVDEPDVSLRSKDTDAPTAPSANTASSTQAAATPPIAVTPPAPAAPAFNVKTAEIDHTFAAAAQKIGVDAATTSLLAHAFGRDIDFSRDVRPGDRMSVVFGDDAATGNTAPNANTQGQRPLAVRLTRGADTHDVFLYKNLQGKPFYYSKDGAGTRPSFSRYPVDFSRVSSPFALRRLDPVTHRWQSHDGVDLAAPIGTPIHATAQGVVRFIGRQTGYGKVIKIQNPAPYSTVFAHLSRFAKGLHRGSRVSRDQVIGYVGETGWATGPHLHYEVHVRHVPRDPLTVPLPQTNRLTAAELHRFQTRATQLTAMLPK